MKAGAAVLKLLCAVLRLLSIIRKNTPAELHRKRNHFMNSVTA
ncbi:hypothetical protein HMPREF9436_02834 [Faecalibacterium cf. prausnitzii KLE1255]|uniref:Uncharacterized protein n=1 Tax=Faecalibacterium cf. prausnitzii KLE1255 TaxID=748224 RepID=E2ZMB7_9FIRM|nr:hypothetical protein HMPREF9436_02834 [Faecalibacterium cf. prausnitzii KLE1255]